MALSQTEVSQLYVALLNRASEQGGNEYWQGTEGNLAEVADTMMASAPDAYDMSDRDFIVQVYMNTVGTIEGHEGGIEYWLGDLENGATRGQLVANMIAAIGSAEYADTDEQKSFNNRVEVSNYVADNTADLEASDSLIQDLTFDAGGLGVVGADLATVEAAKKNVDELGGGGTDTSELTEALASLVEAQDERADAVEDLETAVDAVGVLATTLSTAATVFNGTTAVELEIYSADAAALVAAARNELASERQTTSDQALRDAVATEQRAINGDTVKKFDAAGAVGTDFTARDLQVRAESAQAAANAHVSNNGSDLALASALDNAIGRYLNAASDVGTGELRDVQVAYNAVLAALEADPVDPAAVGVALTAWTSSIDDALEAVFGVDSSAPDYRSDVDAGNSTLNENVAAAAGLEQALLLANQRFALQEDAVAKEAAFGGTGMVGEDLRAAQDELQGRNELIKLLADARDAEAAVNGSIEDFQAAEAKLAEAAETLGYEVEALDNGFEYGTDAADLFLFGEATPTTVILSDFAADDALYLGGKVVQGNLGSADNNQLEFFISSNAAGDAVVQIENSVFGSVSENFTEITLTGVSVDSLNVDGGLITVVDVA